MTTQTKVNEFRERYSEAIAAEMAQVRPGEIVSPDVEAAMNEFFEAVSGLRREQFLSNPFGFPMMPIPIGGRQRLPANVALDFMGHPAFWLDERVADQREGESEEHWAIRLYMELLIRGWWDSRSGEWFDVLKYVEYDLTSPAVRQRLETYRDGQPDADLAALVIEEIIEGVTDLNGPSEYADEIIAALTPVLHEVNVQAALEVQLASDQARLLLDLEFVKMAQPLIGALKAYRDAARAGQWQVEWRAVTTAAYELREQIDEMFASVIDAAGPLVRASATGTVDFLDGVYALADQVQTREDERHNHFDTLMLRLREHGTDDAAFQGLYEALRTDHAAAVAELRSIFDKVDAIDSSGNWQPPEDPEEQPEDSGMIVMPAEDGGEERAVPMLRSATSPASRTERPPGRPISAAQMLGVEDLPES